MRSYKNEIESTINFNYQQLEYTHCHHYNNSNSRDFSHKFDTNTVDHTYFVELHASSTHFVIEAGDLITIQNVRLFVFCMSAKLTVSFCTKVTFGLKSTKYDYNLIKSLTSIF